MTPKSSSRTRIFHWTMIMGERWRKGMLWCHLTHPSAISKAQTSCDSTLMRTLRTRWGCHHGKIISCHNPSLGTLTITDSPTIGQESIEPLKSLSYQSNLLECIPLIQGCWLSSTLPNLKSTRNIIGRIPLHTILGNMLWKRTGMAFLGAGFQSIYNKSNECMLICCYYYHHHYRYYCCYHSYFTVWYCKYTTDLERYCWWTKSCTTWDG